MANPKKRQEKADAAAQRKQAEDEKRKEKEESEKWSKGARDSSKKAEEAAKKATAAARKAERDKQEMEELKSLPSKPRASGSQKTASKREAKLENYHKEEGRQQSLQSYSASNLDDALDLLSLGQEKAAKDSIEKHPERRYPAALEKYKSQRLSELQKERPHLRLQQYNDIMVKEFVKHPDNPFNKVVVNFNAKQHEVEKIRSHLREQTEKRLAS